MTTVDLPAAPAPISLGLDRTALIVVDMQNPFASPGGLLFFGWVANSGDLVTQLRG